jgi:hypothetical protein
MMGDPLHPGPCGTGPNPKAIASRQPEAYPSCALWRVWRLYVVVRCRHSSKRWGGIPNNGPACPEKKGGARLTMNHTFHPRVSITSSNGDHIRYVPGALAGAMVQAGSATPRPTIGRVSSVALARTAATCAHRIGEPTAGISLGVRFTRWLRLDASASRIIEHHPRCMYE